MKRFNIISYKFNTEKPFFCSTFAVRIEKKNDQSKIDQTLQKRVDDCSLKRILENVYNNYIYTSSIIYYYTQTSFAPIDSAKVTI